MKKIICTIQFILLTICIFAQTDFTAGRYRISFSDKNNSPYSIDRPQEFLSQKAIDRRTKFNIAITEQDIPVNQNYIQAITKTSAIFCNSSKWFNSAIFYIDTIASYQAIKELPFVSKIEYVAPKIVYKADNHKLLKQDTITQDISIIDSIRNNSNTVFSVYGNSLEQNYLLGTLNSHIAGHLGQGVTIAVIDAGFLHVDSAAVFQKLRDENRLLFTKDLSGTSNCLPDSVTFSIFEEGSHGMMVLSLIGGFTPGKLIGTAPRANFILLQSEESETEYVVEEDNWVAAAEVADSAGADIISTSLGYSNYDDKRQSYIYKEMDGKTARISRGSDIASSKGMLLINSAGNEGDEPWKYITAPADAESVLTVGACNRKNKKVKFSSFGPTADGRTKPDVMALGLYPTIVTPNGKIANTSGGTSFACPLIAGCCATLWEEFPDSSAQTIKQTVMRSATRWEKPNNKYGQGTPNISKARNYFYAKELYKFFSSKYTLPEFDIFFEKLFDKNFTFASDFVFVVETNTNYSPSFLVRNHNYSSIELPSVSEKGGKIEFMLNGLSSTAIKITNK